MSDERIEQYRERQRELKAEAEQLQADYVRRLNEINVEIVKLEGKIELLLEG